MWVLIPYLKYFPSASAIQSNRESFMNRATGRLPGLKWDMMKLVNNVKNKFLNLHKTEMQYVFLN